MASGTIGGQIVAVDPGDAQPSGMRVVVVGGLDGSGNIQPLTASTAAGVPDEQLTPVTIAEAAGVSLLNLASLGWRPQDFEVRIQFEGDGATTIAVEVQGPAGEFTEEATGFAEDDIAHLTLRYPAVRVVWTGSGGSAIAHVTGHRPL